jgi:hypothetical protein
LILGCFFDAIASPKIKKMFTPTLAKKLLAIALALAELEKSDILVSVNPWNLCCDNFQDGLTRNLISKSFCGVGAVKGEGIGTVDFTLISVRFPNR